MNNQEGLMSETAPIEGQAPAAEPVQGELPLDGSTAVTEAPPEAPPAEPDYDYLDVEDPSSKYVKIKVDGEEQTVPLSEALNGYQRQADYTRKTQELSEANQVYQAMQANPGLTMQVLAQRAGMSVEQYLGLTPQQQQQAQQDQADQAPQFDDPLERELYETRQQVAQMQRQMQDSAADAHLRQVTTGLKEQYGLSDDEVRGVVQQTASMKLGIDAIPMVYRAMAYDRVNAQQQAATDVAAQQQQAEQQRQAAAAAAQTTVAPGAVSANGVTQAAPSQQARNAREAILMAFDDIESRGRR